MNPRKIKNYKQYAKEIVKDIRKMLPDYKNFSQYLAKDLLEEGIKDYWTWVNKINSEKDSCNSMGSDILLRGIVRATSQANDFYRYLGKLKVKIEKLGLEVKLD